MPEFKYDAGWNLSEYAVDHELRYYIDWDLGVCMVEYYASSVRNARGIYRVF